MSKKQLGEGSFGSVCKATQKTTGAVRAIKKMSKQHVVETLAKFKREVALMKEMDHPNIIKLYETFEDKRSISLVMEICEGGELFDRIVEAQNFTETVSSIIMQQICRATHYMHSKNIAHRDIKPENFLFLSRDPIDQPNCLLKVIDFGLSRRFKEGEFMTTKAGTPFYVSPECLEGRYNQLCDTWSIGVVMYILLCGYPPFHADDEKAVLVKVRRSTFDFPDADWKFISESAKDLIRKLLKKRPGDRMTAEQALKHRWTKEHAPEAEPVSISTGFISNLKNFHGQSKLKKVALHVIASQLDASKIHGLRQLFTSIDTDGSGEITVKELREGLAQQGLESNDFESLMASIDVNGSGMINYTEFVAASLDMRQYLQEDVLWQAFSQFDRDGSGTISKDELRLLLGDEDVSDMINKNTVDELMAEIDKNGDGQIDFEEFVQMMRTQAMEAKSSKASISA